MSIVMPAKTDQLLIFLFTYLVSLDFIIHESQIKHMQHYHKIIQWYKAVTDTPIKHQI